MKTEIIVQARMTSTRLPGKVLKQVLGKSLLEYQIERLQRVKLADEIVIATTTNQADEPIVDVCNHLLIAYFCGSDQDVLERYSNSHTPDVQSLWFEGFATYMDFKLNALGEKGISVPEEFEYSSDKNTKWLSAQHLLEMLKQ